MSLACMKEKIKGFLSLHYDDLRQNTELLLDITSRNLSTFFQHTALVFT